MSFFFVWVWIRSSDVNMVRRSLYPTSNLEHDLEELITFMLTG